MNGGSDVTELKETAAEVAALIPRYSWELMDEEQRDTLMEKVVLPRHGEVTTDGVTLTYRWWGDAIGAHPEAVKSRILRLRAKKAGAESASRAEPNSRAGRAATTLKDPDKAREILSDPNVRASVMKALDTERETRSDHPAPTSQRRDQLDLLVKFRRIHATVEEAARLVVNGHAVVSDAERDALLDEVRWLRSALDHIESGLNAGSLDKALAALLEGGR